MTLTLTSSSFGAPRRDSAQSASLVGGPRLSDEREFETLFLEHYSSLCEFVDSYVHAPDVAEEIVQAVFLRLWESRDSWEPRSGARAYLFAACRNQSLDYLRHERIVARTAEHAIDLSGVAVKASILRAMIARNIVKRTPSGRYFLDQSRVHEAYGASNSFILYAMGAFILLFLVIMFW